MNGSYLFYLRCRSLPMISVKRVSFAPLIIKESIPLLSSLSTFRMFRQARFGLLDNFVLRNFNFFLNFLILSCLSSFMRPSTSSYVTDVNRFLSLSDCREGNRFRLISLYSESFKRAGELFGISNDFNIIAYDFNCSLGLSVST